MNGKRRGSNGLPAWVSVTVVLVLLANLTFNIVYVGPEAYPTNVILGGLIGAYAGIEQLVRKRIKQHREKPPRPDETAEGGPPT